MFALFLITMQVDFFGVQVDPQAKIGELKGPFEKLVVVKDNENTPPERIILFQVKNVKVDSFRKLYVKDGVKPIWISKALQGRRLCCMMVPEEVDIDKLIQRWSKTGIFLHIQKNSRVKIN